MSNIKLTNERLFSLDLFRGITMFFLVVEGTHLYNALLDFGPQEGFWHTLILQFHHHPWNGLRFWDLIQPFFMFIVGVAMAYSLEKRWSKGQTWMQTFKHIIIRCLILLFLGVILHCGYKRKLVWELWNVLAQLSFTIMLSFLIFKLSFRTQLLISIGLLLLTEILYRFTGIDGYDKPFVQGENFGAWMDMVLMGKINPDGWVAINCIPTAAHTIWGVLAGKLLQSTKSHTYKIKWLLITGTIGLAVGYSLDWINITPIIKRICTSSFILASGGWCLVVLAFCYWLTDVKNYRKGLIIFTVVGTNPIFIYMFSNTVGYQWFNHYMEIYSGGILGWFSAGEGTVQIVNALVVLALEWYLCWWFFKRKIFIKI
ncbi:MAG: N-acetylglucosamine transporter [Bacteroides sp. SM23_62_1]|nr:MAG: N-acetylglucosamine transporter [Bacteroides sp. SM23_62_1]